MKKKLIATMLTFVMSLSLSFNVSASEVNNHPQDSLTASQESKIITGEELSVYAEVLGFDMYTEDGYTLDSIVVSYERLEDTSSNLDNSYAPYAIGDYVSNVSKVSSDVYFPNDPLASNWFDGPLSSITKTYEQEVTGTYNCTASVSADVVEAGVDFSVTESVTKTTEIVRPAVLSTQRLNIKEYGVYDKYSFTLYSIFSNEKGTGYAYKPMGLYIAQALYKK